MGTAMLLMTAATSAAGDVRETIVLRVENRCGLPPHLLEAIQQTVTTIYDEIDVGLVWVPAAGAPSPELTGSLRLRVVLPDEATEQVILATSGPNKVLGVAPVGSADVYVFCGQVASMVTSAVVDLATVLGRALAHEIGHQVLPGRGHARTGIMRAELDYRTHRAPGFTDAQTRSIQGLLMAHRTRP